MTDIEKRAEQIAGKIIDSNTMIDALFHNTIRNCCIEMAKTQQKIDIEDRFGTINHIQSVLNSIISNAETMTSGNVAHHRASIKLLAEELLNYVKAMEE